MDYKKILLNHIEEQIVNIDRIRKSFYSFEIATLVSEKSIIKMITSKEFYKKRSIIKKKEEEICISRLKGAIKMYKQERGDKGDIEDINNNFYSKNKFKISIFKMTHKIMFVGASIFTFLYRGNENFKKKSDTLIDNLFKIIKQINIHDLLYYVGEHILGIYFIYVLLCFIILNYLLIKKRENIKEKTFNDINKIINRIYN